MVTTALGVSPDLNDNGVTPLTHRQVLAAMYPSTGIMTGLAVTGRNDLTYNVSAGVAVTSIGVADGNTISYWEGGVTPKVDAGDPTNPRIDAVWVRAHNLIEHNDADNFVVVGVTQGTASANPVAPTIPAGALLLGTRRMPANATNTSSATAVENGVYAVPHGASLGMLGEYWWQADLVGADTLKKDYYEMPVTITVPTKRLVRLRMVASLSAYNTNWGDQSKRTEWAFCFQLDGRDIDHSGANFIAQGSWETKEHEFIAECPAGTHTFRLRAWRQNGERPWFHYSDDQSVTGGTGDLWVGRRFTIYDAGVAVAGKTTIVR
ncbi:hypothetical protein [Bifidobacterium magnum]|uniref:Putative phage protein gp45 n=1 Tax=Bifidobacterium magnum TaxID=1692 RepID=A0A087B698_9BIFI|nr:hypothetical protein [Bifidobacterium magnum]KFI66548.1 putative phage protein gp45 [Bifidobacterium magnum]